MVDTLNNGENVLVIWESGSSPECLKQFVEECKNQIGDAGKLSVENVHRLAMASFPASQFDVVFSGVFPQPVRHDVELLGEEVRVLRPRGRLVLLEAVGSGGTARSREKLLSLLTVSGLARPSEVRVVSPPVKHMLRLQQDLHCDNLQLLEVHCNKPGYEVGSSVQLSFAGSANQRGKVSVAATAAVWRLDDTVDDDIETIDPDELLDESDLKKPDPASLRVCSTTGKRKACKNCSCGLAEELAGNAGTKPASTAAPETSSCGNCYLGDAFRCASCPYLGMPAFKPGDKVALTDNQLRADIL